MLKIDVNCIVVRFEENLLKCLFSFRLVCLLLANALGVRELGFAAARL